MHAPLWDSGIMAPGFVSDGLLVQCRSCWRGGADRNPSCMSACRAHARPSVLINDRALSGDGTRSVSSNTRQSWLLDLPPRRETVQTTNQLVRVTPRGNDRRSSPPKMGHSPNTGPHRQSHFSRTCLTPCLRDSTRQELWRPNQNRDTA